MRGRKKKDLPPAKERFVGLRFTEEQYSVLEHNAKAAQLSVSEYIRRSVTGQKIPVFQPIIHDEHEILEELRKINKVGSNLNQIARHLNQGGVMTNPLAAELKGIARMLHDMSSVWKHRMMPPWLNAAPWVNPSHNKYDQRLSFLTAFILCYSIMFQTFFPSSEHPLSVHRLQILMQLSDSCRAVQLRDQSFQFAQG